MPGSKAAAYAAVMLISASAATTPASAQTRGRDSGTEAVRQSFQAEHRAWLDDFARWKSEHAQAEATLRRMLAQLEGDNRLQRHIAEVEQHGHELASATPDLASMAVNHARQRSAHEEMRVAHNRVIADIAALRTDLERELGPDSPIE